MRKRSGLLVILSAVLTMFLMNNISYANETDVDKFAEEQLKYYIEWYNTGYQNYGFSS